MTEDYSKIPEDYIHLLERIEKVEKKLSSIAHDDVHKEVFSSAHEKEEHLDIIDESDLHTDNDHALVKLQSQAYLKIALHAKKYANKDIKAKKWVEVIGLLTGYVINENTPLEQIVVTDAWPVGHGDAVSVSIMETKSFTDIITKISGTRTYIVGWYHSHPSYGNFLSIDDYETQARYQGLWNKSIAIVVDPTQISTSDYGYSVFRNTSQVPSAQLRQSYTELSTEVEGMNPDAAFGILNLVQPALKGKSQKYFEY